VRPFAFIVAGLLLLTLPRVEGCRVTTEQTAGPATAAVYVYEKDDHAIPAYVTVAINRLNRERKIVATLLEDDTTNGDGEIPAQYRLALEAARKAGLPAVVALAGGQVIRVTQAPASEAAVMEAVP
jgi:hypothetical protein